MNVRKSMVAGGIAVTAFITSQVGVPGTPAVMQAKPAAATARTTRFWWFGTPCPFGQKLVDWTVIATGSAGGSGFGRAYGQGNINITLADNQRYEYRTTRTCRALWGSQTSLGHHNSFWQQAYDMNIAVELGYVNP